MTVSSTTSRVAYIGNGVTTSFSFPYYFINKSDLMVFVAGVLQVLDTNYTIAGTAPFPSGQNIVFSVTPASSASIVIVRTVAYTQTLDLVENDPLPAEDVEKRFDLITMMVQQQIEQLSRAIVIPITDVTGTSVTIPVAASRANQGLAFDAAGNVTVGAIANATVSVAMQPVVAASTLAVGLTAFGFSSFIQTLIDDITAAAARTTLGAAAAGANTDITSLNGITNINGGQLGGFRNKIINGDFRRWDYSTTYTLATAAAYGSANRWAVQGPNTAGIFNQDTSAPNTLGFKYNAKLGRNAGSALTTQIIMAQVLESVNSLPLRNQTVTLSYYAKAGANFSSAASILTCLLGTGAGTDQSSQNFINGSWSSYANAILANDTLTTSWQRFQHTVTLGTGITQLGVEFYYNGVGTAGADDNIYITGVQLEIGAAATPFEDRGEALELSLCRRYLPAFTLAGSSDYPICAVGQVLTTTTAHIVYPFMTQPRVAPTGITVSSQAHFALTTASGTRTATTGLVFNSGTLIGGNLAVTLGSAVLVAGNATTLWSSNASAQIFWTGCEL